MVEELKVNKRFGLSVKGVSRQLLKQEDKIELCLQRIFLERQSRVLIREHSGLSDLETSVQTGTRL